jgi:hypothetical protein
VFLTSDGDGEMPATILGFKDYLLARTVAAV